MRGPRVDVRNPGLVTFWVASYRRTTHKSVALTSECSRSTFIGFLGAATGYMTDWEKRRPRDRAVPVGYRLFADDARVVGEQSRLGAVRAFQLVQHA